MRLRNSAENVKNVHVSLSDDNINNSLGCLYWVWKLKKKSLNLSLTVTNINVSWLNPPAGKVKQILRFIGHPTGRFEDGPILPARDFPRWSREKKFSFWLYNKSFIDQAPDGWILASYFFAFSLTSTSSRSIKTQKRTWPISGHLDLTLGQYAQETTAATVAIKQ